MNTKETLNKVRTLLGIEVKLEQMKLDNGAILEAEVFEVGAEIQSGRFEIFEFRSNLGYLFSQT